MNHILGFVDNVSFKDNLVTINGWCCKKNSKENMDVSLYINGKLIETKKASLYREDLKDICPNGIGGFEFTTLYNSSNLIEIRCNNKILPKTKKVEVLLTPLKQIELDLEPILVMPTGRNGSTMLMSLLNTSEEITMDNKYPFENRYFLYFLHLAKTLQREYVKNSCWKDENLMDFSNSIFGPMLFNSFDYINKKILSQDIFKDIWKNFSKQINKDKKYKYYAEKSWIGVSDHLLNMFNIKNVKKIILLRDPRDVLVSIKKFNEKRGYNSFGWLNNDTYYSYANDKMESYKFWFNYAKSNLDNNSCLILRYEDLITNQLNEIKKIENFLNLKLNPQKLQVFDHHMTSKDIKSSLYKWKKELDNETIELFKHKMGNLLQFFNYEI